ncbi:hypothetical protein FOA52_012300 [Chlamydomonas sp. UWO 241]|nr:hypothetical protein FOA52_012300 [Chlamydomonas sp. UWO 241]
MNKRVPDWRKCGPAVDDILPNLKEAFGFFTSGKCLSCEQTGTKDYLQDPACLCTYNTPMCLGACCVPCCSVAML